MQSITIFQDYKNNISEYKECFDDILRFKEIIGDQNCILEANGDILIRNYIGTFSTGKVSLQVLPKVYASSVVTSKEEIEDSLALVYRLLIWSGYLNIKALNAHRSIDTEHSLLEIIIRLFIDEFLQLHRRNIYREYQSQEEELLFLKGKVLFHKSQDYNPTKRLQKTVQFNELTINNPINQIIKTILRRLLSHTQSTENRKWLHLSLNYLEEVDTIPLNNNTFENLHFNRINQEYKPIIELARILSNQNQPGLATGLSQVISFTLQLNLLYEYFVFNLLNDIYRKPFSVRFQSGGYLAKNTENSDCFLLKPDFRVLKGSDTIIVLDTKFKNPITTTGDLQLSSSDIYQMCTYAIRFRCKHIVLIFPLLVGQTQRKFLSYKINNGETDFKITPIQIDIMKDDYKEIQTDLSSQLQALIELSIHGGQ